MRYTCSTSSLHTWAETKAEDGGWSTETAPELKSQAEYGEWLFGSRRGDNGLEEKRTWSAMRLRVAGHTYQSLLIIQCEGYPDCLFAWIKYPEVAVLRWKE
jgi:hypothetical protein